MNTRLILNADDFGRSPSINQAVIQAHREGVLTSASLMVNGGAFDQAVEFAKANPSLGVGLHLTMTQGRSTLTAAQIPSLIDADGNLPNHAVICGLRYFLHPGIRVQLTREIQAQFERFRSTGLKLDHINGHLNMHLHPTVFDILVSLHPLWLGAGFRVTRDDFSLSNDLSKGRWWYRASHAFVFNALSRRAMAVLRRLQVRTTHRVFGLLQNDGVDEDFLLNLLPRLPAGSIEVYAHPSLDTHRHELDALLSLRVADTIKRLGIERCRYQDL